MDHSQASQQPGGGAQHSPHEDSVVADALVDRNEGLKYWNSVDSDVSGMLGGVPDVEGFSTMSRVDLQGSRNFLAKLGIGANKPGLRTVDKAIEGGAG